MAERTQKTHKTLEEFYPFYLAEHRSPGCRVLHFIGTGLALVLVLSFLLSWNWRLLLAALVVGYGLAFAGHLFFEHNRPTLFADPLLSFLSDIRLFFEILTRRRGFRPEA